MTLKTTLLAGVATVALAISPALAAGHAPAFHIGAKFGRTAPGTSQHVFLHMKSNIHDPAGKKITSTVTQTGTLSIKADYKKKIALFGYIWRAGCTEVPNEKWKLPAKTKVAKIGTSTSTGTLSGCTGTTFNFYDVDYTLESKTAKSDTFVGDLDATYEGYKLKLIANVDLTFTK